MSLMPAKFAARSMLVVLVAAGAAVGQTVVASAATPPLSAPHIVAHFDVTAGQQPENITLEPNGSADLSFATSHQIVRVSTTGKLQVLATLPTPADGGVNTPLVGSARTFGITRAPDGTLFFAYNTGTADLTGLWRLRPGGTPQRIAALPTGSLANGLALDPVTGMLYTADSAQGIVWRVPETGGTPTEWATGAQLNGNGSFGANGLKVHNHAVWVSNTAQGLLLRIPIDRDGKAGAIQTDAMVPGLDDFVFPGPTNTALGALNGASEVALVAPHSTPSIVLTNADGLQNPTSLAVAGHTVYVASAAYATMVDPNLLLAHLS